MEDDATVILKSRRASTRIVMNVGWFSKMIFPNFNFRINLHGTVGYASSDHFAPRNLRLHAVKEATLNLLRKIVRKNIHPLSYTYYYYSFFKIFYLGKETKHQLKQTKEIIKQPEKIKKQIEYWEAILKSKPYCKDAYLKLSLLYYQIWKKNKSQQAWQKANYLDPNNQVVKKVGKLIKDN